ncbi:MAG: molecular chaperone DnaJ, partial [Halioglobus sp.]
MSRLILLLAVAGVLYLMYRRVHTVPPHKRRAEYIKLGVAVAVAVVLVLTLTGRMHWLGAVAAGLLVALRQLFPVLIRLVPLLAARRALGQGAPSQAQTSTVETA